MTASCIFFVLLSYVEHLVYRYFGYIETIKDFGCGGESWAEGFTYVVSCCVRQYPEHAEEFVRFVSYSIGVDVFLFVPRLLSLAGAKIPR